jgi:nucleotide-binding universal stress UspA family protein
MGAAPKLQPILPKPVEISNILLATDFSPSSAGALQYACTMAENYGAKLFVLHVLAPEPRIPVPMDMPPELDTTRTTAEESLTRMLNSETLQQVVCEPLVERGEIADVIPTTIKEHDIDLVVLGTHGRRGMRKLLLGSVAEQIFRMATCPVLTVGPEVTATRLEYGEFPHIVFATDFSPASLHALPYALSLAKKTQARLTLMHAIHEISECAMEYLDEVTSACRQRLTELLPPGAGAWCHPEFVVEFGPAADMILKVAEEEQADLIIMGAKRKLHMPAATHLPWPTAYLVAAQAVCPVLTVRG